MEKSIIKIVNMSFKYKKEDYLFRNFNLEIKEGSFTTIIGKNGSGKSTLAKILIGLYKAEGYIAIDGYLLNDFYMKKIRREFSVCFDNADNHFIGETVKDDLAFTLENLEYSKKEMTSSINMIAKKFKLEDILELSPDKLTNSEKEKVMIASALIMLTVIHGVEDVLFLSMDGVSGLEEGAKAIFPNITVQRCIVHLIRNSIKYVPNKHNTHFTAQLKKVYGAASLKEAEAEFERFKQAWSQYPGAVDVWVRNWQHVAQLFSYGSAVRKILYTTNAVESVNSSFRKVTKKGAFPNENALLKLLYLRVTELYKK